MIENLDDNVGRLESFLSDQKLRENTVLIFLTDNGSTFGDKYFPCGMKGKKVTLWEGGHRVPLFIRWPQGELGPARDISVLTHVQDLFPTVLELARVENSEGPTLDGVSIAPLMRGTVDQISDRALFINYSRMPVAQNVQDGKAPSLAAEVKMEGTAVLWKQWRWLENARLYDVQSDPMQEQDVALVHPEIASDLRGRLEAWWENSGSRANEPQSVVIGHEAENPALLTACEWWNVFVDQQSQVRRGELKEGIIHLEIARDGTYEWELRRWPREAALPLNAFAPATKLTDGQLLDGKSLPIEIAKLQVGGQEHTLKVLPLAEHATFRTDLRQGKTTLQATFCQADGSTLLGAYYVYVRRL
jgi:arylsulfatase